MKIQSSHSDCAFYFCVYNIIFMAITKRVIEARYPELPVDRFKT